MNRFIKALLGTAVGLGIAANAFALTGYNAANARQTIEYIGTNTAMPGLAYKVPALAQNAIDTCFVNVAPVLRSYIGGSSAPTLAVVTGYASTVAGDSLNVSIDVGINSEGPWLNVVNFANAYSHTAALPVRNNLVATSTLLYSPFWRVRLKSKGTATLVANKKFFVYFPSPAAPIPPK